MNPAAGSEVRDRAVIDVESFVDCIETAGAHMPSRPPVLQGDVRTAYVAAFIAELMVAERISLKRLRAAIDTEQVPS